MKLVVTEPDGGIVAKVDVDTEWGFGADPGQPPGFVLGDFEPGPSFDCIRDRLSAADEAFDRGDHQRVLELQDQMEQMGLVATDADGVQYLLSNICFKPPGLLFACSPKEG